MRETEKQPKAGHVRLTADSSYFVCVCEKFHNKIIKMGEKDIYNKSL